MSNVAATQNLSFFDTAFCLVGHTHYPVMFVAPPEDEEGFCQVQAATPGAQLPLGSRRMIVNVGSVGQPRDGNPRACYVLLDLPARTLEYRRVDYPIETVQQKMRGAALPARLYDRLSHGY